MNQDCGRETLLADVRCSTRLRVQTAVRSFNLRFTLRGIS
jgi:hypothetical protein